MGFLLTGCGGNNSAVNNDDVKESIAETKTKEKKVEEKDTEENKAKQEQEKLAIKEKAKQEKIEQEQAKQAEEKRAAEEAAKAEAEKVQQEKVDAAANLESAPANAQQGSAYDSRSSQPTQNSANYYSGSTNNNYDHSYGGQKVSWTTLGGIIGDKNTFIYHVPGQRSYMMWPSNAVHFSSESEAQSAGYRRALR